MLKVNHTFVNFCFCRQLLKHTHVFLIYLLRDLFFCVELDSSVSNLGEVVNNYDVILAY